MCCSMVLWSFFPSADALLLAAFSSRAISWAFITGCIFHHEVEKPSHSPHHWICEHMAVVLAFHPNPPPPCLPSDDEALDTICRRLLKSAKDPPPAPIPFGALTGVLLLRSTRAVMCSWCIGPSAVLAVVAVTARPT